MLQKVAIEWQPKGIGFVIGWGPGEPRLNQEDNETEDQWVLRSFSKNRKKGSKIGTGAEVKRNQSSQRKRGPGEGENQVRHEPTGETKDCFKGEKCLTGTWFSIVGNLGRKPKSKLEGIV